MKRLFLRVYLYFGLVLVIMTAIIGVIFINLNHENVIKVYDQEYEKMAKNIANKVYSYSENKNPDGFSDYLGALDDSATMQEADVWILTNPKADKPLASDYINVDIGNVDLPKETQEVLDKAYAGKVATHNNYDKIYGTNMIHLATPIRNSGGNVVGAVLINASVEMQEADINQSQQYLLLSILVALGISIVIAIFFTRQITHPIERMKQVALSLAAGNYVKTEKIRRRDEIGQLAKTLNIVSEQLEINEKMRQQEEQRRQDFFSNVSHELRTPITVMKGYMEALNDGYISDAEKQKDYYERVLTECTGMERLVADLLVLSKMSNPEFMLSKEVINVIAVLQDSFRSVRLLLREKGMEQEVIFDDECAFIYGDYDRIRQLFLVLLNNAIQYCQTGAHIIGEVYVTEDVVEVHVRDDGPGIPEEDAKHIFQQFYRGDNKEKREGSGLGLVVARSIVERHEGDIYVMSEEGKGSDFVMVFPKVEPPEDE